VGKRVAAAYAHPFLSILVIIIIFGGFAYFCSGKVSEYQPLKRDPKSE